MTIDIDAVTSEMLDAVKASLALAWNKLDNTATSFFEDHRDRLETLAQQRLDNEIDDDFFQKRLQDEATILASDLCAEDIITQVAAQNAANAALDVLNTTIEAALKL